MTLSQWVLFAPCDVTSSQWVSCYVTCTHRTKPPSNKRTLFQPLNSTEVAPFPPILHINTISVYTLILFNCILYCFILFYIVLCSFILFYIILYWFTLFYIVLYCFILFYIVLYCFILFYIVLYCFILFDIV